MKRIANNYHESVDSMDNWIALILLGCEPAVKSAALRQMSPATEPQPPAPQFTGRPLRDGSGNEERINGNPSTEWLNPL